MKSKNFQIPESQQIFLSEILDSVKRRSKSLNYNTNDLSIDRIFEEWDEGRGEKIEIRLIKNRVRLLLCVWEDRWITVSCATNTKGVKWNWFYEGKYLPLFGGKDMIEAIEKTFGKFYQMTQDSTVEFEAIWKPLLARKLEAVR